MSDIRQKITTNGEDTARANGMRLRIARTNLGLSAEQLANMSDVAISSIWRMERGIAIPNGVTLKKLAHTLGVSVDWLLSEEPINLKEIR